MPFAISFDIKRAGYAEQFVQNLQGTSERMLNDTLSGIKDDIAANAPKGSGENPKAGDIKLSESFYTIPATILEPSVLEGYIASSVPAKARALEYGSGLHGPGRDKYPIYPRNARFLRFQKEGKTLILPFVMHPGVYAQHYIDRVLRQWRPLLAARLGEAVQLAAVHHWGTY